MQNIVTCPICGRTMKTLTVHLVRTHKIRKEQFLQEYGEDYPLVCESSLVKYSNSTKAKWQNPKYSSKMKQVGSEVLSSLWSNEDFRQRKSKKQSDLLKAMWKNEDYKEMFLQNIRNVWNNPQHQEKMKQLLVGRWKDESFREKMIKNNSEWLKNLWHDPKFRENNIKLQSQLMRERWQDKEFREYMLECRHFELLERWQNSDYREKALKNLMGYYPHKVYPVIDSKGDKKYLRSSWEVRVFDALELLKIPYEYESLKISYSREGNTHTYIPDFYLPELNLVIEVKPSCYMLDDIVQTKRFACENSGYSFIFVTEFELIDLENFLRLYLNKEQRLSKA